MNAKQTLIESAISKCDPPNGSELARRLGVTRSAVSVWKQGGTITEKHVAGLVALAGVDASFAVQVLAEQASSREEKKVWGSLLDRLRPVAAAVGLLAIGTVWSGAGRTTEAGNQAETMCIMRNRLRRLATAARRCWDAFTPRFDHGSSAVLA